VAAIDEVVQGVRGGGLVGAPLDLAEPDVINDQEFGARPGLEAAGVGAVGEASVEIVEEIDAAGVAHGDALLARAHPEGLEEVALAGAVVAGDHEVVVPAHEVEAGELEHEGLVEAGLEGPVEDLERLALDEAAAVDAARDPLLELVRGLEAEDVLDERGGTGPLAGGPCQELVELREGAGQSEELEVSAKSGEDRIIVAGSAIAGVGSGLAAALGHAVVSSERDRGVSGRRSYSVRSRGTVRA
jgi:hypothetical protein